MAHTKPDPKKNRGAGSSPPPAPEGPADPNEASAPEAPEDGALEPRVVALSPEPPRSEEPTRDMSPADVERLRRLPPPNELGLRYDRERDRCFHLNPGFRHGVCTVQGNAACPFLGGNQEGCPHYKDRDAEAERRRKLPPAQRYRMDRVDP